MAQNATEEYSSQTVFVFFGKTGVTVPSGAVQ